MVVVGVLELQGDFAEHTAALRKLGAKTKAIRTLEVIFRHNVAMVEDVRADDVSLFDVFSCSMKGFEWNWRSCSSRWREYDDIQAPGGFGYDGQSPRDDGGR